MFILVFLLLYDNVQFTNSYIIVKLRFLDCIHVSVNMYGELKGFCGLHCSIGASILLYSDVLMI